MNTLDAQALHTLHANTCEWSASLSRRMSAALEHYARNIQALDGRNAQETAFMALCRHSAIWRLHQFKQEIAERIGTLNASAAVQAALRLPGTLAVLDCCGPDAVPDRDTAQSNEEWHRLIDAAFGRLVDCCAVLQQQLLELVRVVGAHLKHAGAGTERHPPSAPLSSPEK